MDIPLIGKAKDFQEKINNMKNTFFLALDDFKKYYVYYNKNPEVNEFQSFYANSKGQLQTMSRDLFTTSNDIDKNIEDLEVKIQALIQKIKDEKELYAELSKKLQSLVTIQNSSILLIDDSKEEYNSQYYNNWNIFFGILLISGLLVKLGKNAVAVPK